MAGLGRYSTGHDWDSMGDGDDYDRSSHNTHNCDGNVGSNIQRDFRRLYITNLPPGLSVDDLRVTFKKFGEITEIFMSRDTSKKKYAFVKYKTFREASLAMRKMNMTEPLNLIISISYKTKPKTAEDYENQVRYNMNGTREHMSREDNSSRSRPTKKQDNRGSNMIDEPNVDDNLGPREEVDSGLNLALQDLKLQQLKLKEEQLKLKEEQLACQHHMLLLGQVDKKAVHGAQASYRGILPDGKIEVRNLKDQNLDSRDGDASQDAGACALPSVSGLQPTSPRRCARCGAVAGKLSCAGCGVTPYCSKLCHGLDWRDRYTRVCRALISANIAVGNYGESDPYGTNGALPLLRPKSPTKAEEDPQDRAGGKRHDDSGSDNSQQNVKPRDGCAMALQQLDAEPMRTRNTTDPEQPNGHTDKENRDSKQEPKKETVQHQPFQPAAQMNSKANQSTASAIQKHEESNPESPKATAGIAKVNVVKEAKEVNEVKEAKEVKEVKITASVESVTPKKKISPQLVPKSYLIEELDVADILLISVVNYSSECHTKKSGYVCLSMHDKYYLAYDKLCEDYLVDCEDDTDAFSLTVGGTFSYYNQEDSAWYRARCLSLTSVALLDSGKVAPLTPGHRCKRLKEAYAEIPEFGCLLDADVKVGQNLKCKIRSKTSGGCRVTMEDFDSGKSVGVGHLSRWLPDVEYPSVTANCGNVEVAPLENLYPGPQEMTMATMPTVMNVVKVPLKYTVTAQDPNYLENFKEQELILTLPNESPSAPYDSEVDLTLMENNEFVNVKLEQMCQSESKKTQEKGDNIIETRPVMYKGLKFWELTSNGCTIGILDSGRLMAGESARCEEDLSNGKYVYTTLKLQLYKDEEFKN